MMDELRDGIFELQLERRVLDRSGQAGNFKTVRAYEGSGEVCGAGDYRGPCKVRANTGKWRGMIIVYRRTARRRIEPRARSCHHGIVSQEEMSGIHATCAAKLLTCVGCICVTYRVGMSDL